MQVGFQWVRVAAMVVVVAATGCVERLIYDTTGFGGGNSAGQADTETDGIGVTDQITTADSTVATTTTPGTECEVESDCDDGQTCFEGVCVGEGSLRISLSWEEVTDFDLHVFVPNGDWMSYENPLTDYGELDVDDCVGGTCINQNGTHVENVLLYSNAPRGTYGIRVVNFDGRSGADYQIEVAGAVSATFSGYVPGVDYAESPVHQITW